MLSLIYVIYLIAHGASMSALILIVCMLADYGIFMLLRKIIMPKFYLSRDKKEEEKAIKDAKEVLKRYVAKVEAGEVNFSEDFLDECKKQKITDVSSGYQKEKAKMILLRLANEKAERVYNKEIEKYKSKDKETIMRLIFDGSLEYESHESLKSIKGVMGENIVSSDQMSYYYSHMEELLKGAVKTRDIKKQKAEEEEKIRTSVIHDGDDGLSGLDRALLSVRSTGRNKRIDMAKIAVAFAEGTYSEKIAESEHYERTPDKPTPSPTLIPKRDWAIEGGLASGIAGPVAGYFAASEAMAENKKIDQYNSLLMTAHVLSNQNKVTNKDMAEWASESANRSKNTIQENLKTIKEAEYKIVFDEFDKAEIGKKIEKTVKKVEMDGKKTVARIVFQNKFDPKIPDVSTSGLTVDGYFNFSFYCDGSQKLGSVENYPLPLKGIPCGKSIELTVPLAKYMEGKHSDFNVKISAENLWLMEI